MSKAKRVIEEYNKSKQEYLNSIKLEKTLTGKLKRIIPNLLTKSRIIAPFLIIPASILGNFTIATIIAAAFGLTDAFDGKLARKWQTTSEYGATLDTISDKMFALGLILPLLFTNFLVILPTLILEFAIGYVNTKAKLNNKHPKSSLLGKVKTAFLYTTLALLYLSKCCSLPINYLLPLLGLTNIIQLSSVIQYKNSNNKEEIKEEVIIEDKKEEIIKDKKLDKIKQEIREYQQIKEDLLKQPNKEKEFVKRIEK